jgi:hypothetical protein
MCDCNYDAGLAIRCFHPSNFYIIKQFAGIVQCAVNDGYKNQTAINHGKMHERFLKNPIELINLCESLIQLRIKALTVAVPLWLTLPLKKLINY